MSGAKVLVHCAAPSRGWAAAASTVLAEPELAEKSPTPPGAARSGNGFMDDADGVGGVAAPKVIPLPLVLLRLIFVGSLKPLALSSSVAPVPAVGASCVTLNVP